MSDHFARHGRTRANQAEIARIKPPVQRLAQKQTGRPETGTTRKDETNLNYALGTAATNRQQSQQSHTSQHERRRLGNNRCHRELRKSATSQTGAGVY